MTIYSARFRYKTALLRAKWHRAALLLATALLLTTNAVAADHKISAAGIDLIQGHEGTSFIPYRGLDSHNLTVCSGHVILPEERLPIPVPATVCADLLRQDIVKAEGAMNRCIRTPLEQHRIDPQLSLAFNIGNGAYCGSTLVRRVNERRWQEAADQFGRWVYVRGQRVVGLVRRRAAERAMFLGE